MSIVSGYKKFKKYILTSSGFQLVSHWTKANTLEFDDGKTAQAKLGAIDGISSSRESNSDKIAASTALVSELNSDLSALNDSGAIIGMNAREDGVYITYHNGADTVIKKLGSVLYAGFLTPTSYNQNGPGNANFDLKPLLSNYASLTTANMCIEATYFKGFEARVNNLSIQGGTGYTYTYDATTGMLTVSGIGTVNYSYKSRPEKLKLIVLQDNIA